MAINTTFVVSAQWLRAFCRLIRECLPSTKVLIGGYFYATYAREFLGIDADVCCVGEGEVRSAQIVSALKTGSPLEAIPGLYLRRPDGSVHHTGPSHPLNMSALPPVNWSLAERIEPKLSLADDYFQLSVETQRGWFFKCEFCTYRTIADLSIMGPEQAVDTLLTSRAAKKAILTIVDATATVPHARFKEMMR